MVNRLEPEEFLRLTDWERGLDFQVVMTDAKHEKGTAIKKKKQTKNKNKKTPTNQTKKPTKNTSNIKNKANTQQNKTTMGVGIAQSVVCWVLCPA